MLPGADGVEVCRKVRKSFSNPIVMLTASDNEFAEIAALNLGADSYLTKPIKPQVLLAHIQATLRRSNLSPPTTLSGETIEVQDISLNHTKREVRLSGEIIELTTGEYEVLYLLMLNAGKNVSRDELYLKVKGMEYDGVDRSIDLRISHLRKKLGDEEIPYRYLKTVRNKGYQLAI
jgi:DNA-binding response OmpR family regulator